MSRTIKFRVWDKKLNDFWHNIEGVKPAGVTVTSDGTIGIISELEENKRSEIKRVNYFEDDFLVIQQFTGLKDKKGKDIYEGDLYNLEGWSNNPYYCVFVEGRYWNRRHNQLEQDFLNRHVNVYGENQHALDTHCKYAEVIGNIFENPDLLK